MTGLSRKAIFQELDASLRRTGTGVCLISTDSPIGDPHTPIEETLGLFTIVRAGKVRYLGASSMWAWQFFQGPIHCQSFE